MKDGSTMFSFMILCVASIACLDIKQNLGYAWLLRPHTMSKLIFLVISLSIK